jgi:hypothetical protein
VKLTGSFTVNSLVVGRGSCIRQVFEEVMPYETLGSKIRELAVLTLTPLYERTLPISISMLLLYRSVGEICELGNKPFDQCDSGIRTVQIEQLEHITVGELFAALQRPDNVRNGASGFLSVKPQHRHHLAVRPHCARSQP